VWVIHGTSSLAPGIFRYNNLVMWKKYKKAENITYAFGVSPTIECIKNRKECVVGVILNPKGNSNEGFKEIDRVCKEAGIPIEVNQKITEKLSLSENTYAVTILKKYKTVLDEGSDHVVLVNPSDMGNVGTICRTMLGLDFVNLAVITPAVDMFDPKVIRASMGAFFSLNVEIFNSLEEYITKFSRKNYLFMCDGSKTLENTEFVNPCTLIFGNEGAGIDYKYSKFGETVKLIQNKKVDSYNLAVSVGIALYYKRSSL
jgi:RNA methyltransferase, TrmH family